ADRTRVGPVTLVELKGKDRISVFLVTAEAGVPPGDVVAEAIDLLRAPGRCRPGSGLQVGDSAPGVTVGMAPGMSQPTLLLTTVPFEIESNHDLLERAALFGLATAADTSRGHFPRISKTPLAVS